jgi:hypothetical protein
MNPSTTESTQKTTESTQNTTGSNEFPNVIAYGNLSNEEIALLLQGKLAIKEPNNNEPILCEEGKNCCEHAQNCNCADCNYKDPYRPVFIGELCESCQDDFDIKYKISYCECMNSCHYDFYQNHSRSCKCGCMINSVSSRQMALEALSEYAEAVIHDIDHPEDRHIGYGPDDPGMLGLCPNCDSGCLPCLPW